MGFEHDLCNTGRALHLYRTSHEFKSLTGMNFFQALFLLLLRIFFLLKANGQAPVRVVQCPRNNQSDPTHGWGGNALGLGSP